METPTSVPEVVAWIGLDWADQRHEIRLVAAAATDEFHGAGRPAQSKPNPFRNTSGGLHFCPPWRRCVEARAGRRRITLIGESSI